MFFILVLLELEVDPAIDVWKVERGILPMDRCWAAGEMSDSELVMVVLGCLPVVPPAEHDAYWPLGE